ncbi:hypothetical protein [Niveispirillum irakense]|uniref:hypothetical protein n=1 Tax=Niveispirillum irakense TaxID=34011 RepID=UPI0012B5CD6B|nr:hypothetical protein [Niveispirillum irakense]
MRAIYFLALALMALSLPAMAQQPSAEQQPPAAEKKAPPAQEMEEEIIVRGRRDGEPDFQTQYEYHKQEYDRLNKIYGPETSPNRRLDRMTDTPNPDAGKSVMRSPSGSTVQGRTSSPVP